MMLRHLSLIVLLSALALPATAYVDIQPSLGRIVNESRTITLVEVEKVSREKSAIIYKKVTDLWRVLPTDVLRHQLTSGDPPRPPRHLMEWARPGRRAVVFSSGRGGYVCTGEAWYRVAPIREGQGDEGWAQMTLDCPELALTYRGSADRLAKAVSEMLARRPAVITTVAHGAQGRGSFSEVVFDLLQSGPPPTMQRMRASLDMPPYLIFIGDSRPWFVGLGAVVAEDLPRLLGEMTSTDRWTRIDAIDDIALLGAAGKPAADALRRSLEDPDPLVRLHAARSIFTLDPTAKAAADVLDRGLADDSPDARVEACRCIGKLGPSGPFATTELVALINGRTDQDSRSAAIVAIGNIGPAAAPSSVPTLLKCLNDPALRCQAAEALGRLGAGAQAALPALANVVEDPADPDAQWSAAKAMVLIGGDGAKPVVPFLIRRTETAPRGRELYQLTWLLGLLGPVAKDAIPALREAQSRDNELVTMALWAISPEDKFPWQLGYHADRPCDQWLFADYIDRMGPARTKGPALALVDAILNDRAGRVPSWGYHLLVARSEVTVPALVDVLKDGPRSKKYRAARVLGRMGPAAAPAQAPLEALSRADDSDLAAEAKRAISNLADPGK